MNRNPAPRLQAPASRSATFPPHEAPGSFLADDTNPLPTFRPVSSARNASPAPKRGTASTAESRSQERARSDGDAALRLYLHAIDQVDPLTEEAQATLAARVKQGDRSAREHLIRANLRRVVTLAREYEGRDLALLDLISEGNLGLLAAVDQLDSARAGQIEAYLTEGIRNAIKPALAKPTPREPASGGFPPRLTPP